MLLWPVTIIEVAQCFIVQLQYTRILGSAPAPVLSRILIRSYIHWWKSRTVRVEGPMSLRMIQVGVVISITGGQGSRLVSVESLFPNTWDFSRPPRKEGDGSAHQIRLIGGEAT